MPIYVERSHTREHHDDPHDAHDAPLAVHELKTSDAVEAPEADNNEPKWEGHNILPYRRTALHVPQDFDA